MSNGDPVATDSFTNLVTPGTNVLLLVRRTEDSLERTAQLLGDRRLGDLLLVEYHKEEADALRSISSFPAGGERRLFLSDPDDLSPPDSVTVDSLPDPTNLSITGIKISSFLRDAGSRAGQTAVCFHSLGTLLEHSNVERIFKFLHVLNARIAASDALGLFYIDPTEHSKQTVYTLESLFDAVVPIDTIGHPARRSFR